MKKIVIVLVILVLCGTIHAKPNVGHVQGNAPHTLQSAWRIADEELSADTQTNDLGVTERTKKKVDALIAANASNEKFISLFFIPSKWNTIRLRAIGITDGGTRTDQIYFGELGDEIDCDLVHAAQLAWTIGTQTSIYHQIAFTSGGTYVPQPGDTVTGNTSGETAVIISISALTSGAWADGDAAGTITYRSSSGAFTNSETVKILKANLVRTSDAFTHAGSDLIAFEMADTLTRTAKSWQATWSETSPADNTVAEAEVDRKGADLMIIVTTATSVDTKLLITGD